MNALRILMVVGGLSVMFACTKKEEAAPAATTIEQPAAPAEPTAPVEPATPPSTEAPAK